MRGEPKPDWKDFLALVLAAYSLLLLPSSPSSGPSSSSPSSSASCGKTKAWKAS